MNLKIRAVRRKMKKTQSQVAQCADISENHYQNLEYGKKEPKVGTAIRIADALGVSSYETFKEIFGHPTTAIEGQAKQI